jgi:hypothetical protein
MQSGKALTPYRRILMEKTQCPDCGRVMSIRNLQHRHKCKSLGPSPEKLERMKAKATGAAIEAHATRMMKLRGSTAPHSEQTSLKQRQLAA